ncbi:CG3880, partial [Drosophila busckii]
LDALPKQFVMSMKKLFDILDDKQSGYVRYADIERGWQDDGSKGLPQGVLDSLRRVTPPSGLLSFERFCAGLKLCLLRNQQQDLQQGKQQFEHRGSADGGSSSTSATDYALSGLTLALPPKKSNSKRRESRRHTLQHGIDYNMLKRLKHLEEQRELLLFGLDGVEKARDFFMQQVLNVQEQIKYFGRLGARYEQWTELQQERLNYQRARVLEANRSLAILTDTWEHGGYPLHINLALPRKPMQHLNYKDEADLLACEKQALVTEFYEQQQQQHMPFRTLHNTRNMSEFVLSQPSPVSQSSAGLGDADVVY